MERRHPKLSFHEQSQFLKITLMRGALEKQDFAKKF
jgi:hypothetical protein